MSRVNMRKWAAVTSTIVRAWRESGNGIDVPRGKGKEEALKWARETSRGVRIQRLLLEYDEWARLAQLDLAELSKATP